MFCDQGFQRVEISIVYRTERMSNWWIISPPVWLWANGLHVNLPARKAIEACCDEPCVILRDLRREDLARLPPVKPWYEPAERSRNKRQLRRESSHDPAQCAFFPPLVFIQCALTGDLVQG